MWRPEGWDSVSIAMHAKVRQDSTTLVDMVEAGADAMLEALKSKGIYNYSGFGRVDFPNAREGWFTFIPEG